MAFDDAGNLILELSGEADRIQFSKDDIALLQSAVCVILLHNHPGGWDYPPEDIRHFGRSFSRSDMILAAGTKLAEIRAITPRLRFILRPPQEGWGVITAQTIADTYDFLATEVRISLINSVREGKISLEEADFWSEHERCKRVAEYFGLEYHYEEE